MLAKAMQYETTPVSLPKGDKIKQMILKEANRLSTSELVWMLVKRHKFGLVTTYAIVLSVLYITPWLPGLLIDALF